jgi:hypothetical protein
VEGQAGLDAGLDEGAAGDGMERADFRQVTVRLPRLEELGFIEADEIPVGEFQVDRERVGLGFAFRGGRISPAGLAICS